MTNVFRKITLVAGQKVFNFFLPAMVFPDYAR